MILKTFLSYLPPVILRGRLGWMGWQGDGMKKWYREKNEMILNQWERWGASRYIWKNLSSQSGNPKFQYQLHHTPHGRHLHSLSTSLLTYKFIIATAPTHKYTCWVKLVKCCHPQGPVSGKAPKAKIVWCGVSLIPPLHLRLHGVSQRQHLDASICVLPSGPAFALGEERQGTRQWAARWWRISLLGAVPPSMQDMAGNLFQTELAGGSIAYLQVYMGIETVKWLVITFKKKKCLPPKLLLCTAPGENHAPGCDYFRLFLIKWSGVDLPIDRMLDHFECCWSRTF